MSKPTHIWLLLTSCAVLIFGTMAWMTHHVLQGHSTRRQLIAEADLQDRVRLSLSRIDSAIGALLIVENQRPPSHYYPFFRPADLFTNTYQKAPQNTLLQPSPLLTEDLEFTHLHFRIDGPYQTGRLFSPQVPRSNELTLAQNEGISLNQLETNTQRLQKLSTLFEQPAHSTLLPPTPSPPYNGTALCVSCHSVDNLTDKPIDSQKITPNQNPPQEIIWDTQTNPNNALNREIPAYQTALSNKEKIVRSNVTKDIVKKATQRSTKAGNWNPSPQKEATAPSPVGTRTSTPNQAPNQRPSPVQVRPLQAHWIGTELFLIRHVKSLQQNNPDTYQGLWLNAHALQEHLLALTTDLLPKASLQASPFTVNEENHPNTLSGLPWQLLPNETSAAIARTATLTTFGWTSIHSTLALGWFAALIAFAAIALLLRGVLRLSERRASFVSSVTHELRTPLTTFRLYSEMLADGMVTEKEKRQDYLRIMQSESERLNHLVENVLAYSQIERGTARSQTQTLSHQALTDRLQPTFQRRADQEKATLKISLTHPEATLTTDLTAIEQILFNLLDNACKYGLPDHLPATQRILHLHLEQTATHHLFNLTDPGHGIPKSESKKLFQPFHKSAQDAALSKPGVGLGLALSRRLAHALNGTLTHNASTENNTFTLAIRK